jgi:hypothetical protein
MNFMITWLFDKFGYMPKIDMQVGKVNIETKWPFPAPKETVAKKKPALKKATTRKAPAKKAK